MQGPSGFRSSPPPGPLAAAQRRPAQAPSVSLGFRAAADLLSPLALLRFSAVARGPDPPTGARKERAPGGGAEGPSGRPGGCVRPGPQPLLAAPQGLAACEVWVWPTASTSSCSRAWSSRSASWCTSASSSAGGTPRTRQVPTAARASLEPSPGSWGGRRGAVTLAAWPCEGSTGRTGVLTARPSQGRTGEDVFLHRSHHGHHPGRLRPADPPWQGDGGCEAGTGLPGAGGRRCRRSAEAAGALRPAVPPTGHPAARPCLAPCRLGTHAAPAGPGAAALRLG